MSDTSTAITAFTSNYGRPALLALLLHALLLVALHQTEVTPPAKLAVSEPIVSYLYQPPRPAPAEVQPPVTENTVAPEVVKSAPVNIVSPAVAAEQRPASQQQSATPLPDRPDKLSTEYAEHTTAAPRQSLAQRAFNRAATVDPVVIEQAATANYQQLLQTQQQPRMTVEKRHQQLSVDPAGQVFAQLDHGLQLIRTKGGCRFADPSKDGFDALMTANAVVPCGDEENSGALLKQALEKHSKR